MLAGRNAEAISGIMELFEDAGYKVKYYLRRLCYGVPQTRKRVIFVGYRTDLNMQFEPPAPTTLFPQQKRTLKDATFDLRTLSVQSLEKTTLTQRRRLIIMNICGRFRRFICRETESG